LDDSSDGCNDSIRHIINKVNKFNSHEDTVARLTEFSGAVFAARRRHKVSICRATVLIDDDDGDVSNLSGSNRTGEVKRPLKSVGHQSGSKLLGRANLNAVRRDPVHWLYPLITPLRRFHQLPSVLPLLGKVPRAPDISNSHNRKYQNWARHGFFLR